MHQTVNIANIDKKKPETVMYYNETKFGVDIVALARVLASGSKKIKYTFL